MRLARLLILLAIAAGVSAPAAWSQSFNIDLGTQFGAPSPGYGAAASQPGFWNERNGFEDETATLVSVKGEKTAVTLVPSLPFGQAGFDFPGTTGDDQALLDDYFDLHSVPATFEIRGLAAGTYAVYTYAWAPDEAAFKTSVSLAGRPARLIGGAWPGGFQEGITHSRDVVRISPGGTIVIAVFGIPKGTMNGLQVVQLSRASFSEPE